MNIRGFHWYSEAWYAHPREDFLDQITVGLYPPGGGTLGEFTIRWVWLSAWPVPHLQVWQDAWHALPMFQDLLDWLATHQRPTPSQVAEALVSMGIRDLTSRPEKSPAEQEYASWIEQLHNR